MASEWREGVDRYTAIAGAIRAEDCAGESRVRTMLVTNALLLVAGFVLVSEAEGDGAGAAVLLLLLTAGVGIGLSLSIRASIREGVRARRRWVEALEQVRASGEFDELPSIGREPEGGVGAWGERAVWGVVVLWALVVVVVVMNYFFVITLR